MKKNERIYINTIVSERANVIVDSTEAQRIIRYFGE